MKLLALVGGAIGDFNVLSVYLGFLIFFSIVQYAGRNVCETLGEKSLVHLLSFVTAGEPCDLVDGYDDMTSVPSSFLLEANLGESRAQIPHPLSALCHAAH